MIFKRWKEWAVGKGEMEKKMDEAIKALGEVQAAIPT